MDGPQQLHDAQRPYRSGKASYKVVARRVRHLLKASPETSCRAVIIGDANPTEIKLALDSFGFESVRIVKASPSLFSTNDQNIAEREYGGLIAMYENEGEDLLRSIRDRNIDALKKLGVNDLLWGMLVALMNRDKLHFPCEAGRSLAAISHDGGVYLCHRFVGKREFRLGHILADGLDRGAYQTSPLRTVKKCSTCFAKYLCGGGCKHDHFGMTGSISDPAEDNCRLVRRVAEIVVAAAAELTPADKAFLRAEGIVPRKPCPLDL